MKRDQPLPPVQCAAEGCRCMITRGWFCLDHWRAIAPSLRGKVLEARKAARKAYCRAPRAEQDRLNKAYAAAFEACQNQLRRKARNMNPVAYQGGTRVTYVNGRML